SSTAWWYFDLRDVQSTDDAYVKGNQIAISSLVAGSVISVNYTDTDLVRQGDVLVTLDDTDARINFNKAANNLANTVRKIKQMYIADDQYNANVQEAKIAYQQALADYQRRSRLQGAAAISRENMQHAKDAVDSSKAALDVAVQSYLGNRVL
ncbi:biotin/lipoyl-binding protein, partial [Klebsiella pneumoniae]|nr:biotin/lipoyl-binding protein [Klebsiella pneumoniae]